jgi:GNAT superfamily N-acetyltransferase
VIKVTRCADEQDEGISLEIYNTVWPHDAITMAEVRSVQATAQAYVDHLARVDGEPAGSAVGIVFPHRPDRVSTLLTVLPDRRRRGVGSALFEAVSEWARSLGLSELEAVVLDNDPESLAVAEGHGFVEERRELGVVLHLDEIQPPAIAPPDGVEIVTWAERPDLARGMYEVALEALPDIPGFEDDLEEPFDDWLAHDMQGSGDRPEATFVAVAGDEVVGYAKFSLTDAQPTVAHHDLSAVKRAWRGRGIARALKAAQITWALANGYTELHTRNEERNEPIRRLNESFGYRPGIGRIYLVGPPAGA